MYFTIKNVIWEINLLLTNSNYSNISWMSCLSLSDQGLQGSLALGPGCSEILHHSN